MTVINRRIHDQIIVRNLGPEGYLKVSMIPQGYDPEDFDRAHPGPDPDKFRVTYTGIFDYVQAGQASSDMYDYVVEYLGGEPDTIPKRWAEASPSSWLDGSEPPFLLIHGEKDRSVDPSNSEHFAALLEQSGIEVELWIIAGGDHATIIGDPETFARIEAFLETHLD